MLTWYGNDERPVMNDLHIGVDHRRSVGCERQLRIELAF